jgi:hypothetical protein
MPILITVHGTFAARPDSHGSAWWQIGSSFASEVQKLFGTTLRIDIRPFHWSGANSEAARRQAGKALYELVREIGRDKADVFLIGHSHGGSVIAEMIREASRRDDNLTNLRCWLTIGTPFLSFSEKSSLYQRLNLTGKNLYIATTSFLLTSIIMGIWVLGSTPKPLSDELINLEDPATYYETIILLKGWIPFLGETIVYQGWATYLTIVLVPLALSAISAGFLYLADRRKKSMHRTKTQRTAQSLDRLFLGCRIRKVEG